MTTTNAAINVSEVPLPVGASASPASVNVRRRIAAPPEVLFAAWLDAASIGAWMRPGSEVHSTANIDPVVGGRFRIGMHGAEGVKVHRGTYVEIDPPRRLVFTWASPATSELDTLVTVEFEARDGLTEVSITHEQLPQDQLKGHNWGWTAILERLAEQLGSQGATPAGE